MRLAIFSFILVLFAVLCLAASPAQKTLIFTYPEDTPDSVLEDAKLAIKKAGGIVIHEYKFIKAFVAKTTHKIADTILPLSVEYRASISEDEMISISDP